MPLHRFLPAPRHVWKVGSTPTEGRPAGTGPPAVSAEMVILLGISIGEMRELDPMPIVSAW